MPNTHRRRRRDKTVLSRRVGGVYMNRDDCRRIRRCERTTQPSAVTQFTTADGCVHTDDTTKLSPTSCEFVYTPPTRRDSTVSSRRRCVLGLSNIPKDGFRCVHSMHRSMDAACVPEKGAKITHVFMTVGGIWRRRGAC